MKSRYKIKKRNPIWDKIDEIGFYIYSRQFKPCANGRQGFRKRRISGAFKTRGEAQAMAGMLAIKFSEVKKRVKKHPAECVKTKGRRTNQAICAHCRRSCQWAGRRRIRK